MKYLYYTALGIGVGVMLTIISQKIYSNSKDISFITRRTIDDIYSRLEDAYDAVKRIDVDDVKHEIMQKLDDVKQRFNEFDIGEMKDDVKAAIDGFAHEVKGIINQIEAQLSSQWLKYRDQTA
jgi:predicted HAD superfamily phosphohydrolase